MPISWAGDCYDKRTVLLGGLALAVAVYAAFPLVGSSWGFIVVRGFPFTDLALNGRILTMTSFRAQYAVAVTLVRTWVPIFAGVAAFLGILTVNHGRRALSAW